MTSSLLASHPFSAPFTLRVQKGQLDFCSARRTTRGLHRQRSLYTIICETEDGALGYGEACPIKGLSPEYCDESSYEKKLQQACDHIQSEQRLGEDDFIDQSSIRVALEGALLRARVGTSTPIWESAFTRGECGIDIHHLIWMNSIEQMEQELHEGLDAGFSCVKMKVGSHSWERELHFIKQTREQYPSLEIRVDANGNFTIEEAARRLHQLADLQVSWIEQPLPPHCKLELTKLSSICPSPLHIALDESLIGYHSMSSIEACLDSLRPHGLVLKPSLHGGFTGCERFLSAAKQRGIICWANSMMESQIGLTTLAEWSAHHMPTMLHALSKGKLYCHHELPAALPTCQLEGVCLQYRNIEQSYF